MQTTTRLLPKTPLLACALLACAGSREPALLETGEELPGGDATNRRLFGANVFLPPVENISLENERLFFAGNAFFNQAWTEVPSSNTARDGLGPLFNARSCAGCHSKDGRGRPPLSDDEGVTGLLLRLSITSEVLDAAPEPEPNYGGQLQPYGVQGVPGEGYPGVSYELLTGQYADGETFELLRPTYTIESPSLGPMSADAHISARVAPAMIGLGLLEAIADERLTSLADPDDADGDGISGRLNQVWDVARQEMAIGRFGWKAEQPSVRQQSAGAFVGDMGITSSLFPEQNCSPAQVACQEAETGGDPEISDELLEAVARYGQLLAVPARRESREPEVLRGKAHFAALGCDACHTPSHVTSGEAAIEELREQLIWPYTDLLLHDLGSGLADDRPTFAASGSEWRTPPLWGIGHYPVVNGHDRLLHDGRARGVAEAILWHDGEAKAAKDGFVELTRTERADLIAFVESL